MKTFKITILPGDGIGPEVMDAALAVLDVVGIEYGLNFEIKSELAGGASLDQFNDCLLYTSPSPRDRQKSRMPSSA